MERWIMTEKLVLIGFTAFMLITEPPPAPFIPWSVCLLLLYLSFNIATLLFRKRAGQTVLQIASIILALIGGINGSAFFFLLLPFAITETVALWVPLKIISLILAILPVGYLPGDIQGYYVIIAVFSWMAFVLNDMLREHLDKKEKQLDAIRRTQEGLKRKISENDTFIKQSNYMFKLEERNRISQKIHDDIGHTITGALIQMEAAKKLFQVDEKKAEELLTNAIGITKEGISSIHHTLQNMKPTTEQIGINRLKLYLDEFKANHLIQTTLIYQGDMNKINYIQWKIIRENVQEALTNTLKYAEATQIFVDVTVLNKLIKIEVKDNGKGERKITKGLGIMGMEERAATLDGKILIDGKDGFS